MTQDELDAVVGKVARRYSDKRTTIGVLESKCRDVGDTLAVVGRELREHPESVKIKDGMIVVDSFSSGPKFADASFDNESLKALVQDLHKARQEQTRLEADIKGAGLDNLIRTR